MKFFRNDWNQLKNKTADKLISALEKDGFVLDNKARTERIYRHPDGRRVSIRYYTGNRGYQSGLLNALLEDIGWTERDRRRHTSQTEKALLEWQRQATKPCTLLKATRKAMMRKLCQRLPRARTN